MSTSQPVLTREEDARKRLAFLLAPVVKINPDDIKLHPLTQRETADGSTALQRMVEGEQLKATKRDDESASATLVAIYNANVTPEAAKFIGNLVFGITLQSPLLETNHDPAKATLGYATFGDLPEKLLEFDPELLLTLQKGVAKQWAHVQQTGHPRIAGIIIPDSVKRQL